MCLFSSDDKCHRTSSSRFNYKSWSRWNAQDIFFILYAEKGVNLYSLWGTSFVFCCSLRQQGEKKLVEQACPPYRLTSNSTNFFYYKNRHQRKKILFSVNIYVQGFKVTINNLILCSVYCIIIRFYFINVLLYILLL